MALADRFDSAYIVKHDPQRMLKQEIPIMLLTVSLFDTITKSTTPSRRLVGVVLVGGRRRRELGRDAI